MTDKITAKWLHENIGSDLVSKKKNGNFLFRYAFYYKHGQNAELKAFKVMTKLAALNINAELVDSYENYTSFRGGASIQSQSHFGVEVKIL